MGVVTIAEIEGAIAFIRDIRCLGSYLARGLLKEAILKR